MARQRALVYLSYYARQNIGPLYSLTAEWELFGLDGRTTANTRPLYDTAVYHLSIIVNVIGFMSHFQ